MAFTGWENVKPGEEFSIEEITAFYGNIGPYSMMERPHRSLWGRCPMVVRAITKAAIPGRFAAGEKVLAFLKQEGSNCSIAAFPEAMFKEENFDMRSFVADDEMELFGRTVVGHGYHVLGIESREHPLLSAEKRVIVDTDLCEIG